MSKFKDRLMFPVALFLLSVGAMAASGSGNSLRPDSREVSCAKEGEEVGGSCVNCKICCEGLIPTNSWLQKNLVAFGCEAPLPPGSTGSCVKCGDGKCDQAHSENKCNCPKDCH